MMYFVEVILLAVSLAIDCFTVSVASGAILKRTLWRTVLTIAFFFGLFQALMPFLGWLGASRFQHLIEEYDHWMAFGLLLFLGVRMLCEGFRDEDDTQHFDPTRMRTILSLAVATSIDALAVGISFAFAGYTSVGQLGFPLLAIGLASFVLSVAGFLIGVFFGRRFHFRMEIFGGLVLIGIGVKILLEHLGV